MTGVLSSVPATALAFARRGYAVLPLTWPVRATDGRLVCCCHRRRDCLSPGKHPFGKLVPNGLLSASAEPGVIKLWFVLKAPLANLGVLTDKLIVLDIDPRHGGNESLAVLEKENGQLPVTWRSLTGGGGEHIFFALPEGLKVRSWQAATDPRLGPGIDGRSRGGFIVAPPSLHVSGRRYAFSVDHHPAEVPLALPPPWMIERIGGRSVSAAGESGAAASAEWAPLFTAPTVEYRDAAATRVAGHLFRRWVDPVVVLGLMSAWNLAFCRPPLEESELKKILDRIADREADRRAATEAANGS